MRGGEYKMTAILHSLTLLDTTFSEASKHKRMRDEGNGCSPYLQSAFIAAKTLALSPKPRVGFKWTITFGEDEPEGQKVRLDKELTEGPRLASENDMSARGSSDRMSILPD